MIDLQLTPSQFEDIFVETIRETLDNVVGSKIARALAFYIDVKTALKTPGRFFLVMNGLIGQRLADDLRRETLIRLYKKFNLEYTISGEDIVEELKILKSQVIK